MVLYDTAYGLHERQKREEGMRESKAAKLVDVRPCCN